MPHCEESPFEPLRRRVEETGRALCGTCRAALLNVSAISFEPAFRDACAQNACGNYGQCWMCPPDVGDIHVLIEKARSYQQALIYQTVGTLEDSYDFEGMMEAAARHNTLCQTLTPVFRQAGFARMLPLGSGGCRLCETCAKRQGQPCRHPEDALPSLEAYGVNVSKLAAACGMKYVNGVNTVTYFAGVLFDPPTI